VDNDQLGDHISDLADLALLQLQLLLCLLAVFDVRADAVPLYDLAALVTQRLSAYEKPPIYSIVPTEARLDFPRLS
jgi:hypothetical protein